MWFPLAAGLRHIVSQRALWPLGLPSCWDLIHEPPPHSPTPSTGADSLAQMHTQAGLAPWDPQDLWSPQQLSRSPSVPNSQLPPDLALRDISGSQANSLTQWLVHLDLALTHLLAHLHSLQVLHHGPMDL